MTSIMRRTVRGAAAGAGALAIIVGAAACGGLTGGDDSKDDPTTTEEEAPADEGAEDEGATEEGTDDEGATEEGTDDEGTEDDGAADDGAEDEGTDDEAEAEDGGDVATGPLADEDLTAAADAYYAFFEALGDNDGAAGCGLMLNPNTNAPFTGAEQAACITTFEKMASSFGDDSSIFDMFERSMFEGVDNGDGTAGVSIAGTDAGIVMVKGSDGGWYIDTAKAAENAG